MFSKYSLSILLALALSIGLMAGTAPVQARESTVQNNGVLKSTLDSTLPDGLQQAILEATNRSSDPLDFGDGEQIDQLVYLFEQKVFASDGAAGDEFGFSVALDGDTALIGVPRDDIDINDDQGSVYVFVRSETVWTQQAKLIASDGAAGDSFGWSVSLSGDTALVGAPDNIGTTPSQGLAYIFVRSGTVWTQQAKLTAPDDAAGDEFGISVALDGDTALVGADGDDIGGNESQGSAYIFIRSATDWSQQAKLTAPDGVAKDFFGISVALDGDSALIGAYGYYDYIADMLGEPSNPGSAYVFVRSGTDWSQQAEWSSGWAFVRFGISVALDGDTALVGATLNWDAPVDGDGSAYVFVRSGTTWSQQAELHHVDNECWGCYPSFGISVALSADSVIVGEGDSAYGFVRSGTTWSKSPLIEPPDGIGNSVALSGETILAGAYQDDSGGSENQGSAYFFQQYDVLPALTPLQPNGTFSTFSPTFEWTRYPEATAYRLAVYSISKASYVILDTVSISNCEYFEYYRYCTYPSSLALPNGDYRFKVLAYTASGTTPYSDWMYFKIASAQLSPEPTSPSGTIDGISKPDFRWSTYPGSTSYRLAVYSYSASSYLILDTVPTSYCNDAQCSYPSPVSLSNGNYKFKVLAYIPGGVTPYSDWMTFTITSKPVYPEQKVTASDGDAEDQFSYSVSLSGDMALLGAFGDDIDSNADQGSAYVFVRSGATWMQQTKLAASDGAASDLFGYSVALAGDTALVGAPYDDIGSNSEQGSAYIFVWNGTTWSEQAKLTAPDGTAGDTFGFVVALSGDTALVGVPYDGQGSVYVFVRDGTTWSFQQKLTATDGAAGDRFGFSVALDGDTALVGAVWDDIDVNASQGSAYVFVRSGTIWNQQQKLTASDGGAGDEFGISVALSGETALVGADGDEIGAFSDQGSAYIFTRSGTTWSQQQKLTASDGTTEDHLGGSVALLGNTALVGASFDNVGFNANQGSAYLFARSGTIWAQQAQLTASDGAAGDYFARSVALSDETALVGAWYDMIGTNTYQGSAYFYKLEAPVAPIPISPLGTLSGIAKPDFVWRTFPGSTSYRLAVYSYSASSYLILDMVPASYCDASQCTYPSPTSLSNGDYKFKLLAYTPGGITPYSDWMAFTITDVALPPPPFPPTPIGPNGAVTTHRPTFQWSAVEYAAFYRLAVYSYASASNLILENVYPSCAAGVCSFTHSTIDLPNGNYKFKVLARNSSGYTTYSTWMSFTVSSDLPLAPTLLAPSGTVSTNPPEFQWSAISGATQYRLAVYSYGTGSYIIITNISTTACSGTVCTYTPPSALASGDYKFKMLTYNSYGASGYTDWMSFSVP